jgi:KaiC/GvpD/RAD55 family RecA-like ATPase
MEKRYHRIGKYLPEAMESFLMPPEAAWCDFWPKFHTSIGGLRPREYSILCGATGSGKTAFLSTLTERLATQGTSVFVASVETGPVDFTRRAVSARVKENWNLGEIIPLSSAQRFQSQHRDFDNLPIHLATYEDRVNNKEMINQVAMAVRDEKVEVAILDNLNFFMEVTSNANTVVEMDRVIHDWIMFTKTHDVHVIMVMHPRKTSGRVESEFDIKGSSTAVQEAHNVWLFNRMDKELVEQDPRWLTTRELTIAKCRRRGAAVGKSIMFRSDNLGASYEEGSFLEVESQGFNADGRTNASKRPFGFRGMDE